MVDSKCPQDGFFERQSDQQLQVIAEHFSDINLTGLQYAQFV